MDRIRKSVPFADCVGMTQDEMEKSLTLDKYTEFFSAKKGTLLASQLTRFSHFAENDPMLEQLKVVETVFTKNGNLHQEHTKLKGRIGMYINNHPLKSEVKKEQHLFIFNKLVIEYFNEERPVRQVKKMLALPEKGFYAIIDEAYEERVKHETVNV